MMPLRGGSPYTGFVQTSPEPNIMNTRHAGAGFSLGTLIAVALSWSANHSILWAIIHGFLSWLYVIYYLITRVL
ncbi:hypothetical protein LQR30_04060 [Chromobacterium piscinae]|nr:hypothetical protein [Chromobacterium piscinae]MCD4503263.1 hypothetical protein [Chromobacterium piscinae]NHQ82653.1 hypothetical protein [Chromobacterium vaccinii]